MKTLSITNNDFLRMSFAGAIAAITLAFLLGMFHPAAYLFLILTPFPFAFRSGVELDFQSKMYRKFTASFGRKTGEWKPYGEQHQLVLLQKHGSRHWDRNGLRLVNGSTSGHFYELYIMDPSHTKRLFLNSSKKRQKLDGIIEEITANSSMELVAYNPQTNRR